MSIPRITFNNQNTVLLSMTLPSNSHLQDARQENLLCLLHDNRIFSFKKGQVPDLSSVADSTSSLEQNIILNLLTTPKYRAMSAMYMLFHVLDSLLFLAIIVLCFFGTGSLVVSSDKVSICIYLAICMEVFYDMMLNINRYWLLQRLSIHIGLTLYAIYASLIAAAIILAPDAEKTNNLNLIRDILIVRFASFVLEECVDVAIDCSLHNDLVRIYNQDRLRADREMALETMPLIVPPGRLDYISDISHYIQLPVELSREYNGSRFAWGTASVFTKGAWLKAEISQFWIILLCFIPALITILLVSTLILICLLASIIPIMFAFIVRFVALCCCCADARDIKKQRKAFKKYWREMTYF